MIATKIINPVAPVNDAPLDNRTCVQSYADLDGIPHKYDGLVCSVQDTGSVYVYHGGEWNEVGGSAFEAFSYEGTCPGGTYGFTAVAELDTATLKKSHWRVVASDIANSAGDLYSIDFWISDNRVLVGGYSSNNTQKIAPQDFLEVRRRFVPRPSPGSWSGSAYICINPGVTNKSGNYRFVVICDGAPAIPYDAGAITALPAQRVPGDLSVMPVIYQVEEELPVADPQLYMGNITENGLRELDTASVEIGTSYSVWDNSAYDEQTGTWTAHGRVYWPDRPGRFNPTPPSFDSPTIFVYAGDGGWKPVATPGIMKLYTGYTQGDKTNSLFVTNEQTTANPEIDADEDGLIYKKLSIYPEGDNEFKIGNLGGFIYMADADSYAYQKDFACGAFMQGATAAQAGLMTPSHAKDIDNIKTQIGTLTGGIDFVGADYDSSNTNIVSNIITVTPGTVFPMFFLQNDGNSHTYRFEEQGGSPPYDLTYTITDNARAALTSSDNNFQFSAAQGEIMCGSNGVPSENLYITVTKTGDRTLNLYIATAADAASSSVIMEIQKSLQSHIAEFEDIKTTFDDIELSVQTENVASGARGLQTVILTNGSSQTGYWYKVCDINYETPDGRQDVYLVISQTLSSGRGGIHGILHVANWYTDPDICWLSRHDGSADQCALKYDGLTGNIWVNVPHTCIGCSYAVISTFRSEVDIKWYDIDTTERALSLAGNVVYSVDSWSQLADSQLMQDIALSVETRHVEYGRRGLQTYTVGADGLWHKICDVDPDGLYSPTDFMAIITTSSSDSNGNNTDTLHGILHVASDANHFIGWQTRHNGDAQDAALVVGYDSAHKQRCELWARNSVQSSEMTLSYIALYTARTSRIAWEEHRNTGVSDIEQYANSKSGSVIYAGDSASASASYAQLAAPVIPQQNYFNVPVLDLSLNNVMSTGNIVVPVFIENWNTTDACIPTDVCIPTHIMFNNMQRFLYYRNKSNVPEPVVNIYFVANPLWQCLKGIKNVTFKSDAGMPLSTMSQGFQQNSDDVKFNSDMENGNDIKVRWTDGTGSCISPHVIDSEQLDSGQRFNCLKVSVRVGAQYAESISAQIITSLNDVPTAM